MHHQAQATLDEVLHRGGGVETDAPQLGSSSATRKEEPQPQEATTLGFVTSKPEPWNSR